MIIFFYGRETRCTSFTGRKEKEKHVGRDSIFVGDLCRYLFLVQYCAQGGTYMVSLYRQAGWCFSSVHRFSACCQRCLLLSIWLTMGVGPVLSCPTPCMLFLQHASASPAVIFQSVHIVDRRYTSNLDDRQDVRFFLLWYLVCCIYLLLLLRAAVVHLVHRIACSMYMYVYPWYR